MLSKRRRGRDGKQGGKVVAEGDCCTAVRALRCWQTALGKGARPPRRCRHLLLQLWAGVPLGCSAAAASLGGLLLLLLLRVGATLSCCWCR